MSSDIRNREFLGRGVAFPLRVDGRGTIALNADGEQDIQQAIRLILGTVPGERVMRPEFGCRAWEVLFDPNNSAAHSLIAEFVREALAMWEPRIVVQHVEVYRDPARDNAAIAEILYEIKATHDQRSIVYPFYVVNEEGEV